MCAGWTWGRGGGRAAVAAPASAGRIRGGSAGPGQEGSRRPRGQRKSGGKAPGRGGGGGGRKPGPDEGLFPCTRVPWGHRGHAWVLRERAPALPAVGPKLPGCRERVSPGLQTPLCRPWGCGWWRAPQQPRVGTRSLAPQRGRSCNRLCSAATRGRSALCRGQDDRDPPAVVREVVLLPMGLLAGV